MSKLDEEWQQAILKRFNDREDIGRDELYSRYFAESGLPRDEVFACLDLLEAEYKLPAGVLRPNDKLEKLFNPVQAKNAWQWLVYRSREGDSETEINYELGKRMHRSNIIRLWSHVKRFGDLTVSELLRAWCGLPPSDQP